MLKTTGHMGHLRTYSKRDIKSFLRTSGFDIVSLKTRPLLTGSKQKIGFKKFIYNFLPSGLSDNIVVVAKRTQTAA